MNDEEIKRLEAEIKVLQDKINETIRTFTSYKNLKRGMDYLVAKLENAKAPVPTEDAPRNSNLLPYLDRAWICDGAWRIWYQRTCLYDLESILRYIDDVRHLPGCPPFQELINLKPIINTETNEDEDGVETTTTEVRYTIKEVPPFVRQKQTL